MDDVLQTLWASLAAAALFLPAGYGVGFAFDLFAFRKENLLGRLLLAVPLSIAILPILFYLADRLTSQPCGPAILLGSWLWMSLTLLMELPRWPTLLGDSTRQLRDLKAWVGIPAGWMLVCPLVIADMILGGMLFNSIVGYDYTKHVAVTDALLRAASLPPMNPSFHPGHPVSLYYYYFWFLFPTQLSMLLGDSVAVQNAVNACTPWAGLGVLSLIVLWVKHNHFGWPNPRQVTGIACLLFFVTGFDIVVVLAQGLLGDISKPGRYWFETIEWWNDQVTSWLAHAVWVPHHVGGLVACLTAFLAWRYAQERNLSGRACVPYVALAAVSLASGFGMSIWTTVMAGLIGMVWMVVCWKQAWKREVVVVAISGLAAGLLLAPFLLDLMRANQNPGKLPLRIGIRVFQPAAFLSLLMSIPPVLQNLLLLVCLPAFYFLEWGVFFLTTIYYLRARKQDPAPLTPGERFANVLFWSSLVLSTFVASTLKNNDFGWRSQMFLQFVMLLWGGVVWTKLGSLTSRQRLGLWIGLALGIGSNAYDAVASRINFQGLATRTSPGNHFDPRAAHFKEAYQWLRNNSGRHEVVQHSLVGAITRDEAGSPRLHLLDVEVFHGLYGQRQVALSDDHYGHLYGIGPPAYNAWLVQVIDPFRQMWAWKKIAEKARELKIDWLVVRSSDLAWGEKESWIWTTPPAYANEHVRIFRVPGNP